MKKSFPTLDTLRAMPLNAVRNLDINERDEELLVQKVVDEKLSKVPEYKDIHVRSIDIVTKNHDERLCAKGHVCEEHWQKEVDEKRARARGQQVAKVFSDLKTADSEKVNSAAPQEVPTTITDLVKGKVELTGAVPVSMIPELADKMETPVATSVPAYVCAEHSKTFKNAKGLEMHMKITKSHKENK